jgi:hypothetical protein
VLERGSAIEPETGNAHHGKLDVICAAVHSLPTEPGAHQPIYTHA